MAAPKGTRPPAAGKGRPKGARNKVSRALKEMILAALDKAGGEQCFGEQASKNPVAFMTLLGKVLHRTPQLRKAATKAVASELRTTSPLTLLCWPSPAANLRRRWG
jgi:hypothetical protein